jgi:hypothetical protein
MARVVGLTADEFSSFSGWRPGDGKARGPSPHDCLVLFVGLPLFVAMWGTAVGIGPARVLGFQYGFLYVGIQMLAAWCVNGLTALAAAHLLRQVRPALWVILLAGFVLSWLPLYFFYRYQFAVFSGFFPEIVAPAARPPIGWHTDYLIHAARYSLPFIPMWLGAIYGYRFLTGVQFFADRDGERRRTADVVGPIGAIEASPQPSAPATIPVSPPAVAAAPPFLALSRLPCTDVIFAVKAEEHYIRIWTQCGTDLIRYRFGDALQEIADREGAQVHRSWWINWDAVTGWRQRGRSLELVLGNDLRVPVSLAYKAEAHRRLGAARTPRLHRAATTKSSGEIAAG